MRGGLVLLILGILPVTATAGPRTTAHEVAEYLVHKFGREAAKDGVEQLARRLEVLTARHGPAALQAAKRVGPRSLPLIEDAGEHAGEAARLLAQHGDKAIPLVSSPRTLALIARHGDAAVQVLLKHPGIARPVVEAFGEPCVKALGAVGTRNGRRLVKLTEEGYFEQGRSVELLTVIGRFGDRALEFVWRHKGALAVTAVLAAFLAEPESFLDGVKDITKVAAENVARPLTDASGKVVKEAALKADWTILGCVVLVVLGLVCSLKLYLRHCVSTRLVRAS
jgi:hypothetical protein